MNLNEECLLQYLRGPLETSSKGEDPGQPGQDSLARDMQRLHRRQQYVSFPAEILVKRPHI